MSNAAEAVLETRLVKCTSWRDAKGRERGDGNGAVLQFVKLLQRLENPIVWARRKRREKKNKNKIVRIKYCLYEITRE